MRVLIVSMRYLGDCVVSAALARAVKEKMPDAEVWMLTFKRNLPILEGIDILDGVIGVEAKPSYLKQLKEMASVWKNSTGRSLRIKVLVLFFTEPRLADVSRCLMCLPSLRTVGSDSSFPTLCRSWAAFTSSTPFRLF